MTQNIQEKLYQRGCQFLGCKYPILCGAMSWVSDAKLVSSICNAGGFASLAGGSCPPEILEAEIDKIKAATDKNFGVNIITISPYYLKQLEILTRKKVSHIIFAGRIPRTNEITIAKESGAKVICFCSTPSNTKRCIQSGVDALIIEGMESGGHIGRVSLTVLIQQILFDYGKQIPIFAAGGIATGRLSAHLLLMGAAGIQLGTRFAVSQESCAHPDFKTAYLKANARDAISTSQFDQRLPVMSVRALRNNALKDFNTLQLKFINAINDDKMTVSEAQEKLEEFWMGGLRRAVKEGNISEGSLMAGQSVGLVHKIETVKEIIESLDSEIHDELLSLKQQFSS
ncbi:MAG: nitronate monooxygenase [Lentisphaeria bacterium]